MATALSSVSSGRLRLASRQLGKPKPRIGDDAGETVSELIGNLSRLAAVRQRFGAPFAESAAGEVDLKGVGPAEALPVGGLA